MSVALQTMLDNVETAINNRLTGGGVEAYTITTPGGTRNLKYCSLSELRALRDQLKREIALNTAGGTTNYATFEEPT